MNSLELDIQYLAKKSVRDMETIKKELISALAYVIKDCNSALFELQQGHGIVNSLGILQRAGQDVDRLAALYNERLEMMKKLTSIAPQEVSK